MEGAYCNSGGGMELMPPPLETSLSTEQGTNDSSSSIDPSLTSEPLDLRDKGMFGGNPVVCRLCGFETLELYEMKAHVEDNHMSDSEEIAYVLAEYVTEKLPDGSELQTPIDLVDESEDINGHISWDAKSEKPYSCKLCDYNSVRVKDVRIHIIGKHTGLKPFQCHECPYSTAHQSSLRCHIRAKHTGERPYSCPHCDYTAAQATQLRTHVMARHDKLKGHHCPHCSYSSSQSGVLKRHIQAKHIGVKPFTCHCGYTSAWASNLRAHILKHHTPEGEIPERKEYRCNDCEYSSLTSRALKRHKAAHHIEGIPEEKPHPCSHCHFIATNDRALKVHEQAKHCPERPYSCTECNYSSPHLANLKSHIISRHTRDKPYQCQLCEYRSVTAGDLRRHTLSKHADLLEKSTEILVQSFDETSIIPQLVDS